MNNVRVADLLTALRQIAVAMLVFGLCMIIAGQWFIAAGALITFAYSLYFATAGAHLAAIDKEIDHAKPSTD